MIQVTVADVNGDNHLDLVAIDTSGNHNVLCFRLLWQMLMETII